MGGVKNYSLSGSVTDGRPWLLFQVKIDLHDVRSGCRVSDDAYFKAEMLPDGDLDWARDMVVRLAGGDPLEIVPPFPVEWPENAEEKMRAYLTRHYRAHVWRNPELGLYASPTENRDEFLQRCRDWLLPEKEGHMRKLREVFHHRFSELEQKLKEEIVQGAGERDGRSTRLATLEALFWEAKEGLSRWFISDGNELIGDDDLVSELRGRPDFQERIDELMAEFANGFNRVSSDFEEKATRIEDYEIPINRAAVDIVSTGILWE